MAVDVDRALARSRADLERGEPWKARRRLRTLVFQEPFEPRFAALLGELELRRGELPEAGQFFWLIGSTDPEHTGAIDVFLKEAGPRTLRTTLMRLLSTLREGEGIPERVVRDLESRGIDAHAEQKKLLSRRAKRDGGAKSMASTVADGLGIALVLLLLLSLVVGVVTVGRWAFGWLAG